MRDLCNTDKPLFAVLTKLTYSAYLNILWLVCSLPIVTIGASTTALFYVTLKMAEDRDDGLTRMFFKAFRENFKPATKLWLILLARGVLCLIIPNALNLLIFCRTPEGRSFRILLKGLAGRFLGKKRGKSGKNTE